MNHFFLSWIFLRVGPLTLDPNARGKLLRLVGWTSGLLVSGSLAALPDRGFQRRVFFAQRLDVIAGFSQPLLETAKSVCNSPEVRGVVIATFLFSLVEEGRGLLFDAVGVSDGFIHSELPRFK